MTNKIDESIGIEGFKLLNSQYSKSNISRTEKLPLLI